MGEDRNQNGTSGASFVPGWDRHAAEGRNGWGRRAGEDRRAITAIELLAVVVIIGIISSMAIGVYVSQVNRARFAAARAEIRELEIAIQRYDVDLGEFPPSSSGSGFGVGLQLDPYFGNGFLSLALQRSLSNDPLNPASRRWQGPYMQGNEQRFIEVSDTDFFTSGTSIAFTQFMYLDPWGTPYHYVRNGEIDPASGLPVDYVNFSATQYPATHPFAAIETFFNVRTFQIISFGPNSTTFNAPFQGLEFDDITNFDNRLFGDDGLTTGV